MEEILYPMIFINLTHICYLEQLLLNYRVFLVVCTVFK